MNRLPALILAAILVAAGHGAGAQPALVGSLDCRFASAAAQNEPLSGRNVLCTFLPRRRGKDRRDDVVRFAGTVMQPEAHPDQNAESWIAWGVYAPESTFRPSDLQDEFRGKPSGGIPPSASRDDPPAGARLYGGVGNSIELQPLAPTPGESPPVNLAFGTTGLVLGADLR